MRNPEHFDPLQIGRYTVIRVWYEYPGQRGEEKLFVVLRHTKESGGNVCWCIKATCRTQRYEADSELMKGVILYEARVLPFFYETTIIDPASVQGIWHAHLQAESAKNRYRIEGKMPDDFHGKLVAAIKQSDLLEPKIAKHLLSCIGESE